MPLDTQALIALRLELDVMEQRRAVVGADIERLDKERQNLNNQINAFRIIIEGSTSPPPDEPELSPVEQERDGGEEQKPPRLRKQPEFASVSVRVALDRSRRRFLGARHANDYARDIWVIDTDAVLAQAKRTLNAELMRATRRGEFERMGGGMYLPILD